MEKSKKKIVYCIPATYNSGGMERVLANKANFLSKDIFDVYVITTEQKGRQPFFKFNKNVHQIDLGINYEDNKKRSFFAKLFYYFYNQIKHKKKLSRCLNKIKPDIVISTFNQEAGILHKINNGSKKIIEFHFNRDNIDIKKANTSFGYKILNFYEKIIYKDPIKEYTKLVLLTEEDRNYWKEYSNTIVIPNAQTFEYEDRAHLKNKKVIAVGRYAKIKGFDRLINAWNIIRDEIGDWKLEIFGEGSERYNLQNQIDNLKLNDSIKLMGNSPNIKEEYKNASILVMSSHNEGFPMALIEAKSAGVPIVSFDCPCGPKEIIQDGKDGFLVENGNIKELAKKILRLLEDQNLREFMGKNAFENSQAYSEESIMNKWIALFNSL